jgi:hypothetical protein
MQAISEQLKGLSAKQQRRRLAAMSARPPVAVRKVKGDGVDWKAVIALRHPCVCSHCGKRRRWPAYYVGILSRLSYECVLEMNAPKDRRQYDGNSDGYVSTSSSPTAHALEHARRIGARLDRGCALEPESEEALQREISRVSR